MNEFLKKRIERKLESLPDERVYQVLDYIEFLESKYATRAPESPSALQRLAETVEDTLRAGRVSATAIKSTMDTMAAAGRVVGGIAAAGKAVVDEVTGQKSAPGPKAGTEPPPASGKAPPPKAAPGPGDAKAPPEGGASTA